MRRGRQWDIQRELNARIPRGSLDQNHFRAKVWFWRSRGYSFEDSVTKAAEHVRRDSPSFKPRWIPLAGGEDSGTSRAEAVLAEETSSS